MGQVRKCKYCKHFYGKPCDGKNTACGNYRWLKHGYRSLTEDVVGDPTPKPKKKVRNRLDQGKTKPVKKSKVTTKKKRARL